MLQVTAKHEYTTSSSIQPPPVTVVRQVSFTLLMTGRCNGNPAQYERNRRFRHLVYLADKPMVRNYHLRDYD